MNSCFTSTTVHRICLLLMILMAGNVSADNIFKNNFESGLNEPLYFVSAWQDDQDSNGFFQILASGSEDTFPEITVNKVAAGNQTKPVVAVAANGDFVVVWEDDAGADGFFEIWARGFYADGSQRFGRITINSVSTGQQKNPDIAMSPDGNFVVIWEDDPELNDLYNIVGRGFFADGTPRFSDRTVSTTGPGADLDPAIAMADDGRFVVTWADDVDSNGFYQIKARGFNANGSQNIAAFTVNTEGAGQQIQPDIAMAANGDFVIVWADDADGNWFHQILGRGFFANGTQRFADTTINQTGTANQFKPAVGISDDGRFVAVWVDQSHRIMARQFNANGNPFYADLVVNNSTLRLQNNPVIGMAGNGNFVVLWEQLAANGEFKSKGRRLDTSGNLGPEFVTSNSSQGDQFVPAVGVR